MPFLGRYRIEQSCGTDLSNLLQMPEQSMVWCVKLFKMLQFNLGCLPPTNPHFICSSARQRLHRRTNTDVGRLQAESCPGSYP